MHEVVVVSGETGCGKTTQLPQYILESEIEAAGGATCSIICTQPRRISAMAVAERVAAERGEKIGESVGYKVRLEGMKGRDTRLLFCTTGILLRRLLVDRNLKGTTHVIVDEIHERGMNEDFLLIVLKDLLPRRPELRLILMSATLNAELFSYFGGAPMIHIPKQAVRKRKTQIASAVEEALMAADFKEYSPRVRESLMCWNPDSIGFNLIEHVLCHICRKERPGAVLVFMTGWDDINSLKDQLQAHPLLGDPSRVLLLACHGSMPSAEQAKETSYDALNNPLFASFLDLKGFSSPKERQSRPSSTRRVLPSVPKVQNAIEYLKMIGALDESENLTLLGRNLSMLPVEPKLGKMLIFGAIFNCLDPIMTIVAGLSVRDPFLMPFDKKDLAESAKAQFSARDFSDHLALVRAFEGWKDAEREQSVENIESCNGWSRDEHLIRAVICAGLFPGICSVVNKEKSISLKTMEDGAVLLHSSSVNAQETKIPFPWIVFNEKVKVNSVFLRDSTAVSDSVVLLFGGHVSRGLDGHMKMLGGYLEFFMKPELAATYRLLNPKLDIQCHEDLIRAVRLLVSEDQCEGRFVFGRQISTSSKKPKNSGLANGGGDNAKSHLQTLLGRAGHQPPSYKTKQLKNNKFRSTVVFNGLDFVGQPCSSKKEAEKAAATEALTWLTGESEPSEKTVDYMSAILKKSKKKQQSPARKLILDTGLKYELMTELYVLRTANFAGMQIWSRMVVCPAADTVIKLGSAASEGAVYDVVAVLVLWSRVRWTLSGGPVDNYRIKFKILIF
ncbi:UNVERIFIED_CONTAM: DExH-box ATP-dependent RNA helicase DExH3 [Sesamum calycinum]|uniref:RNA helicase n=1 Tax=Sesamum calycinum TaxID=2727403 RepID=A0AAW2T0K6_9LAMI